MKHRLILIAASIALAVFAVAGYMLMNDDGSVQAPANSSTTTEQPSTTPQTTQAGDAQSQATAGTYTDYSAGAVATTQGQRILFFHAPWCPQCRQLDESIKSGTIPSNTTIFKVDYDSSQSLRQKYGVTLQTTIVLLDAQGNEAKKFVAYDDPSLDAIIKSLL